MKRLSACGFGRLDFSATPCFSGCRFPFCKADSTTQETRTPRVVELEPRLLSAPRRPLRLMATQLTISDARHSLGSHLAFKGAEICRMYGPRLGWQSLKELLKDRAYVRYPCEMRFDAAPLLAGEFAHPVANGSLPEEGFTIYVHPYYARELERVPLLVLYQLVLVNYGPFASADDAENFGSQALGLSKDDYYRELCGLVDQIA